MKFSAIVTAAAATFFLWLAPASAQYKAPSQYFPKSYPAPTKGGGGGQGQGQGQGQRQGQGRGAGQGMGQGMGQNMNQPAPAASAVPQRPKFKDVQVNSQFFFLADTNRAFAWTKISATSAKNNKTGAVRPLPAETLIQR